jgi:predicted ribonuclease YlaK
MLEQVVRELDEKAHHRDSYYAKRARRLQKLLLAAINDPTAFGHGSSVGIVFPNSLPELPNLDLTVPDHRIIAQAIAFQQSTEGAAVTIATSDVALAVRAKQFNLDTHAFPKTVRRDREADAEDQPVTLEVPQSEGS